MSITLNELQNSLIFTRQETINLRGEYIPKSCGLHFERAPLKVIKGLGAYLYSDLGEEFLDCVTCVSHVGHSHPIVVEAGVKAMQKLGSVFYGQEDLSSDYVSKLKTTLPKELDTFLFVSSGSEANDLAIQLARRHTQGFDVVSVDRSFHGCLSSTNSISPRQHKLPGLKPEWVHVLQCPDLYRGKYRDSKAVDKYCANITKVLDEAVSKDRKIACLICEPIMTTCGMIVPPSKWMQKAYSEIRKQGGIVIADEAQSGLGRPGDNWWSFQTHENIVPDILTIGKPLANGYPLAVVVTRSSIAAHLDPEALSHYKCDNVAAAIGLSVIRTIRSESLIQNATNVGTFLYEGLRSLAADHQNIGEVRGRGLMIGVEIVYNRESKKPGTNIAEKICYRMKEEFIIIGNDGPDKNVLIITPPMCFTFEMAHRVISVLDKILKEIEEHGSSPASHGNYSPILGTGSVNNLISMSMLESFENDSTKSDSDGGKTEENIFDVMD